MRLDRRRLGLRGLLPQRVEHRVGGKLVLSDRQAHLLANLLSFVLRDAKTLGLLIALVLEPIEHRLRLGVARLVGLADVDIDDRVGDVAGAPRVFVGHVDFGDVRVDHAPRRDVRLEPHMRRLRLRHAI